MNIALAELEVKIAQLKLAALKLDKPSRSRMIFSFPSFAVFMDAKPQFRFRVLRKTNGDKKLWACFAWFTLGVQL